MSAPKAPSDPIIPNQASRAAPDAEQPGSLGGYFSGAELLISDTRTVLLLLRDARNRACKRLFGLSEQDAALVTLIGLATLTHAANRELHRVLKAIVPERSDAWIAEGALKAAFHRIAGDESRDVPVIATLILASLLLNSLRPVLRESVHDLRVAGHRLRVDFDHRYGHLIRPNRPRPGDRGTLSPEELAEMVHPDARARAWHGR